MIRAQAICKRIEHLKRRPEEDEDIEFLARLYGTTRAEELAPLPWGESEKVSFLHSQFEAQHEHYRRHYPDAEFDIILMDDEPIGRIYIDEWSDEIRLMDIALLPDFRNRGLGSRLLRELQKRAKQAGKPIRIHVEHFNPALRLYQRLGFQLVEDKDVYYFMEWMPEAPSPRG